MTAVVVESGALDGTTFDVAVTGMSMSGTVTITFGAGAATDLAGNDTLAPTLTDNLVNFTMIAPAQPNAPALPKPDGIFATLVKKAKGRGRNKKKVLFVRVFNAVTGALLKEFQSPFQGPSLKNIVVSDKDGNGDGIAETVVLKAMRKKVQLSLEFL